MSQGVDPRALVLVALLSATCGPASEAGSAARATYDVSPDDPWRGPELAEFALVDQNGDRFTRADLLGGPAVLDFVFTTCTGPCPAMGAGMAELQRALEASDDAPQAEAGSVRLVSISVDPERDTPEVLASYAEALGADPERWRFLTGDETEIVALASSVYLRPVRAPEGEARLGEQVTHATKFVVVGPDGYVRGFYDGQSPEGRRGALERALALVP